MKRKRERCESENEDFEPKLTRSKAKELLQTQPNIAWPSTPIKKLTEIDFDFINDELPEESDDEEYKPSMDDLQDHSEEESGKHSVSHASSVLDISVSQYLESFDANLLETSPAKGSTDSMFETQMENIGQRTRSKLCLSDTPLEAIEEAFAPPDITIDMYDFQCDNEDWENFIKELMQPLSNDLEDDDEADPEYYAGRKYKGTKISKNQESDEEKEVEVPKEAQPEIESKTPAVDIEPKKTIMTKTQILLLEQQLREHVQLTTQHFLQSCEHPLFKIYAEQCKIILATLLELSRANENSLFNIYNLEPAFALVEKWEKYLMGENGPKIIEHMKKEMELARKAKKKCQYHRIQFHPTLMKLMSESDVFMYSLLLPPNGFRCDGPLKQEFVSSEDWLIAIGLEQFMQHLKKNPRRHTKLKFSEKAACDLICQYLMPVKTSKQIIRHIRQVKGIESNPINYYRLKRRAPKTTHYVVPFNDSLKQAPCKRPKLILPEMFREFIHSKEQDSENKENDKASTGDSVSSDTKAAS